MNNQGYGDVCISCGAIWQDGKSCEEAFHQCLAWEFDEPQTRFEVHHFLILCYHLQHPHLYSIQGLIEARKLLDAFLDGESTETVRRNNRDLVDQANRDWKITATSESIGSYGRAMNWNMTIQDVLKNGPQVYVESVKSWVVSIQESLNRL